METRPDENVEQVKTARLCLSVTLPPSVQPQEGSLQLPVVRGGVVLPALPSAGSGHLREQNDVKTGSISNAESFSKQLRGVNMVESVLECLFIDILVPGRTLSGYK